MSSDLDLLREALTDMLPEPVAGRLKATDLDADRWAVLEQAGLTHLTLPEASGGGDGSLEHVAALLRVAGERAAPLPVLETWLAGVALHRSGAHVPSGPLSVAFVHDPAQHPIRRVPWGADSTATVVVSAGSVRVVDAAAASWRRGRNLAGEPRDDLRPGAALTDAPQHPCDPSLLEELTALAALGRAVLLAGASNTAIDLTVRHVVEREQFGRTLSAFQSVQHSVAEATAAVAAATAACDAAVAIGSVGPGSEATLAALAAKYQATATAVAVARSAHQLHGAIGFTDEHLLARYTTRLWSWSQEDGTALSCSQRIAELAGGAPSTWQLVVGG